MGKVKEYYASPVLFIDKDGWYEWTAGDFWDNPEHAQYVAQRTEVARFDDLWELLRMKDILNQMMHGKPSRSTE